MAKARKQVEARVAQILTGQAVGLLTVASGTGKPFIAWTRDQATIAAASRLDGLYALATNLPDPGDGIPLTAAGVLKAYKDQQIIEQRHRDLRQTLKVRPVCLHNDDRIEVLIGGHPQFDGHVASRRVLPSAHAWRYLRTCLGYG